MLQCVRESLTLLLIGLLPLHAFLVTVGTRMLQGPGHAPMGMLAVWKEGVLGVILVLGVVEIGKAISSKPLAISTKRFDAIDLSASLLILLSICLLAADRSQLTAYVYGFKYDFIPLIAFLILRRVPWSEWFRITVLRVLLFVGAIVALYGLITLVIPSTFFTVLGYSDLHSLYVANGPLAAFQQIGGEGIRRMQSTFSGPNQLGLWMLIPSSAAVVLWFEKAKRQSLDSAQDKEGRKVAAGVMSVITLLLLVIFFSFSRSAWIAAAVVGVVAFFLLVPAALRKTLGLILGSFGAIVLVSVVLVFPQLIFRSISNAGHIERPIAAIQRMIEHPFGMGLGTAGPASNRMSDTCVELPAGSDASWAKDRLELCVFVGDVQVQPAEGECQCPFLPENWYLQIGVELGVIGMLLWMVMTYFVLRNSFLLFSSSPLHQVAALSFLGISIAALFLHAWEDSAVAYTVWIVMAMSLHITPRSAFSTRL